jgi:hypothetical protein
LIAASFSLFEKRNSLYSKGVALLSCEPTAWRDVFDTLFSAKLDRNREKALYISYPFNKTLTCIHFLQYTTQCSARG